jgi:hypothetical protein
MSGGNRPLCDDDRLSAVRSGVNARWMRRESSWDGVFARGGLLAKVMWGPVYIATPYNAVPLAGKAHASTGGLTGGNDDG